MTKLSYYNKYLGFCYHLCFMKYYSGRIQTVFSSLWMNRLFRVLGDVIFAAGVAWLRIQGGGDRGFLQPPLVPVSGKERGAGGRHREPLSAEGWQDLGSVYMPLDHTIKMCFLLFSQWQSSKILLLLAPEKTSAPFSVCAPRRGLLPAGSLRPAGWPWELQKE